MKCYSIPVRPLASSGLAAGLLACGSILFPAQATLTFNFSFDGSIASHFGSNTNALENDIIAAGNLFSSLFSNDVTLNIAVTASTTPGSLAASLPVYNNLYSYGAVRTALINNASTDLSAAETRSLPLTEPTPNKANAGNNFPIAVSSAQEKALHLTSGNASGLDGTFYIGTNQNWNFAGTTTPASNAYSFFNVTEHELSEIMGRSTQLSNPAFPYNTPIDLFRCTATGPNGAGVINMSPTAPNVYFSYDGCATAAKYYNGPNGTGADVQDWASSSTVDPFDAFAAPGVYAPFSLVDTRIMNVLGWQSAIPEPVALSLLLPAAIGLNAARVRKAKAGRRCRPLSA